MNHQLCSRQGRRCHKMIADQFFILLIVHLNRYMKGRNQFDYPTATATTYKGYRGEEAPKAERGVLYQRVLKQESQEERERTQQLQQRRKESQAQEQQARLRQQIERKRTELLQLQRRKQQALENERRAEEQAAIKQQQDKIKRIEQQQRSRQNDENANYRFREALRRLDAEREELNFRERQAQQRRKTNQEMQRQERQQATQYAAYLKEREQSEREKAEEQQRAAEELYRTGVARHGLGKNIDYSKTCFHNPQLVFKCDPEQPITALMRGEEEERRRKEQSARRREREAEARKKSLDRGKQASERVEAEREYRAYSEEAEREQRDYNIQRIEAGKKNQYIGLKPLTLQQIELNKKARSEQEFEQLFVGSRELPSQNFASKYTILQAKYAPPQQQNFSYSKQTERAEDSLEIYQPPYQEVLEEQDSEIMQREILQAPTPVEKRPMAETRAEEGRNYPKEELSYSESEDEY